MLKRLTGAGKPSALSVATFVLSLCAWAATSFAALLWNPIDEDFINRADEAGWVESMLLPHQMELALLINASVVVTFVLAVTAFFGMLDSGHRTEDARWANPQGRV